MLHFLDLKKKKILFFFLNWTAIKLPFSEDIRAWQAAEATAIIQGLCFWVDENSEKLETGLIWKALKRC